MVTPVTLPCYLKISQSENYAGVDHTPYDPPSLTWPSKYFAETLRGVQGFGEHEPHILFSWPCNNLTVHWAHGLVFGNRLTPSSDWIIVLGEML